MAAPLDFAERYGPWALIAGASEGIGASFARRIAEQGINVALLARRSGPLDALADELRDVSGVDVRTASIDLTADSMMNDVLELVDGIQIGMVVYNAGAVHGAGLLIERPLADALQLVDLNCRGPLLLAHHFGGEMAARGRGALLLMTSMSAAAGTGLSGAYSATKAFDLVLAEALWMELGQHGVDVLGVVAGLTDTPAMRSSGLLMDTAPFRAMLPDEVVDEALGALGGAAPMLVVGAENRKMAEMLWPVPRADLVEAMSTASATLYGLSPLTRPAAR